MSVEHLSLCRCRVLYLGSAIPLETAVGIEALQAPCRDRYDNVDSNQQASGIDSILSVFSSGLMLQYAADAGSTTWFPIQTLHVCAAVKAVQAGGPLRFVSLDTAAAMRSTNPPLFACIMRRTKGVKVLECHVFVCKSNQAAMALVQSCTHAFQHKEGWVTSTPPGLSQSRLVSGGFSDSAPSKPKSGLDRGDLVQRFDVSCSIGEQPKPAAPAPQPTVLQPMVMQQTPCGPMMVPVNPPGAPVPVVGGQYFADWNNYGGQPLMIIPDSPFYPGDGVIKKKSKKSKKKSKSSKKTKKGGRSESDDEETIFVKRSQLAGGKNQGGQKRVTVEEIVQPPAQVVVPPPRPAPQPQIIFLPQPAAPAPQVPQEKKQGAPNDVIVYAPQLIEANRRFDNYEYDGSDRHMVDYHPDSRSFQMREDARRYDGRQDNRIEYNAQDFRRMDYRQDARQFSNREDNRAYDYRADNRSNREDNRALAYRADNRSNRQDYRMYDGRQDNRSNREDNRALYYRGGDPGFEGAEYYEEDGAGAVNYDDEFARGYYGAQVEAYNQYLAEEGADDDGYYPEEYYPQPGYTDDYGIGDYQRFLPSGGGGYGGGYAADYSQQLPVAADGFVQVTDGLGYYP